MAEETVKIVHLFASPHGLTMQDSSCREEDHVRVCRRWTSSIAAWLWKRDLRVPIHGGVYWQGLEGSACVAALWPVPDSKVNSNRHTSFLMVSLIRCTQSISSPPDIPLLDHFVHSLMAAVFGGYKGVERKRGKSRTRRPQMTSWYQRWKNWKLSWAARHTSGEKPRGSSM